MQYTTKFKVGDRVVHKSGYDSSYNKHSVFTIESISIYIVAKKDSISRPSILYKLSSPTCSSSSYEEALELYVDHNLCDLCNREHLSTDIKKMMGGFCNPCKQIVDLSLRYSNVMRHLLEDDVLREKLQSQLLAFYEDTHRK